MLRAGTARLLTLIASIVRIVFSLIGALIVIHAVFVLFEANPSNILVQFTASIRDSFGWFTKNLFTPKDPKIAQAINDVLAGLIWVVVGSLASKLIVRLAPAPSKKKAKDETPRATPVRQKPAEEPKAEEPQAAEPKATGPEAAEPKAEAPKAEEPERQPEPTAQPARAAERIAEPEPEPEAQAGDEGDAEPSSRAKHQARATARSKDEADDKAQA